MSSASLPPHAERRLLEVGASLLGSGELEAVDAGRYELLGELGRGGMGIVYEAWDPELERRVALKMLSLPAGRDAETRERFAREARAAAQLSHPNIATVYEATPERIAMQLVRGVNLDELSGADPRLLAELVRDAALGVHAAHAQGIVHRDIKPANLMVERRPETRPQVYVMDFGLAKATDASSLSTTGGILGTPHYMSPEQAQGKVSSVDARSDVYGLGATLYAVLGGRPPFEGEDIYEVLRRTVEEEPEDLVRVGAEVDPELATIVMKCLEKDPERRYSSALALAGDLDRWLSGEPILARPASALYRLRKFLGRRRLSVRAALIVGLVAAGLVAGFLVPVSILERGKRTAAEDSMALTRSLLSVLADARAFRNAGDTVSASRRLDEGLREASAFLATTEIAQGHELLGRLQSQKGDAPAALKSFDRALELNPKLGGALFERGLLRAFQYRDGLVPGTEGDPSTALATLRARALEDLLAAGPEEATHTEVEHTLRNAVIAFLENDLERATATLGEVLQYDGTNVQALLTMGRIHLRRGDDNLARHYSLRATDVLRGLGSAYAVRGDGASESESVQVDSLRLLALEGVEGALYDFNDLVERLPDESNAYGNKAQIAIRNMLRTESPEEELAFLEDAIESLSYAYVLRRRVAGLTNRGLCRLLRAQRLSALGRAEDARAALGASERDLEYALELEPGSGPAAYNRALLHEFRAGLAFLAGDPVGVAKERRSALADLRHASECAAPGSAFESRVRARLEKLVDALRSGA